MRDLLGYINSNFDICKWIDTNAGITATGREDLYVEVATKYFETLEDHCRKIEDAYKAKNYRDYTIYVHSLKSSSRLIGATDISERSKELEDAGNAIFQEPQVYICHIANIDEVAFKVLATFEQLR